MLAEDSGHEYLMRELGRINSELAAHRRLAAEVVHDLSNPMQVVLGLSELLLDSPGLDAVARRQLDQLHRSATTMSALVADLAQGYSLEGQLALEVERLDVGELVTSVVDRSRLLGRAKDIALVVEVPEPSASGVDGLWIDADPAKLERALSNLIGNAVKFSPRGSVVTVSVGSRGDRAVIAVADQGPGVSEAGQKLIFEVFHREAETAHLPGLGLGLFITRQIAQRHGGEVSVESAAGRGATFRLALPLALDDVLADPA